MAFALKPGKSIRRELTRLARVELGRAGDRLRQPAGVEDAVHEARKSVKKVEALATLLDQIGFAPPRKDVARLRKVRRTLSRVRDADAMIGAFNRLQARFAARIPEHTAAPIQSRLKREKSSVTRRARANAGSFARARKTLRQVRRGVKYWSPQAIDLSQLPCVLRASFRASRKAMMRAQTRGRASDFHAWRKRVKQLWYQLRLAERLVAGLNRQVEEFGALETALGEEHNLAVLRTKLTGDRSLRKLRPQLDELTAMSTALQEELRRGALVMGARVYKLSPKKFERDLRRRLRPDGTRRRKRLAPPRNVSVA